MKKKNKTGYLRYKSCVKNMTCLHLVWNIGAIWNSAGNVCFYQNLFGLVGFYYENLKVVNHIVNIYKIVIGVYFFNFR